MNTYTEYNLTEHDDGSYSGVCATNDNFDRGYPNEYADWQVHYNNVEDMLKHTHGGCHYGMYGQPVIVYVDGKLIKGIPDRTGYKVIREFAGRHT